MPDGSWGVQIEGAEEVGQWLRRFPTEYAKQGFLKAITAMSQPVLDAILDITPERSEGERNEDIGHLKDAIRRDIRIKGDGTGGWADISFGKLAYISAWVEYGHWMKSHGSSGKGNVPGGSHVITGPKTPTGFVQGKPFMRTGLDASADAAVEAFFASMAESIRLYQLGSAETLSSEVMSNAS